MPSFTPERRRMGERRTGQDRRARPSPTIDPDAEEAYWRENFRKETYYEKGLSFDDYRPAYRTGWEACARHPGRSYDEIERELQTDYNRNRGSSRLAWERGKHAVRAGWERLQAADPFERSQ